MEIADFKPVWWLRSPHMQTLFPVFFKKRYPLDLAEETVELEDGDFIDLCWSRCEAEKTVLVLHGLEGSLASHYANGVMHQLESAGFRPVFMHFRGCSGRVNRLPRAYHSGETADMAFIAEHIRRVTGHYPYAAVGFSLGGNALLKWLGESGSENQLKKAIAVSVPFRLADAATRLERGISRIYRNHLLNSLRRTYTEKFSQMESPLDVDVTALHSFREYDDQVTAPLHGFSGAEHYYDTCSSRQYLRGIVVDTRIIHSLDDPFMMSTTVPHDEELSEHVDFLLTRYGGHVGFITVDKGLNIVSWCEQKIIAFLRAE